MEFKIDTERGLNFSRPGSRAIAIPWAGAGKLEISSLLLLFIFSLSLATAEEINGAFGIELGQTFLPSQALSKEASDDGTPMYAFNPKSPYRALTSYYVLITPKSNLVYGIWGFGAFETRSAAQNEQAVLTELLTKKYGEAKDSTAFSDAMRDTKRIGSGNKYALTLVSGFGQATLEVQYYDQTLRELAEKERIDLEASKADADGL